MRSSSCARRSASRWVSGSSSSSRSGWRIRQAARPTSLRWPPDRSRVALARSLSSKPIEASRARASPSRPGPPAATHSSSRPCWRTSTRSIFARSCTTSGRASSDSTSRSRASARRRRGARPVTVRTDVRSSPSGFCSRYAVVSPRRRTTSPAPGVSVPTRILRSSTCRPRSGPRSRSARGRPPRGPRRGARARTRRTSPRPRGRSRWSIARPLSERSETEPGSAASHASWCAFTARPLVVQHRVPGGVAVASLHDHVPAEDALERETQPLGGGARPGVEGVALPLDPAVAQGLERLAQEEVGGLGVGARPLRRRDVPDVPHLHVPHRAVLVEVAHHAHGRAGGPVHDGEEERVGRRHQRFQPHRASRRGRGTARTPGRSTRPPP